jgi:hypothetical protein
LQLAPVPESAIQVETAYRLRAGRDSSATSQDAQEEQDNSWAHQCAGAVTAGWSECTRRIIGAKVLERA